MDLFEEGASGPGIQYQMQRDLSGKLLIQPVKKMEEFLMAMPLMRQGAATAFFYGEYGCVRLSVRDLTLRLKPGGPSLYLCWWGEFIR